MRLLILLLVVMLSGCTLKYTAVKICPEVDGDGNIELLIDTTGSNLTTTTDQKADGKLDLEIPLDAL